MSPRVPMVFGLGLDRETGVMATRLASFEDLRNVLIFEGKAAVRKGVVEKLTFLDTDVSAMTHILAIQPLRSERSGVVLAYNSATGNVNLYGIDATASNSVFVGTWFTKSSDLTTPPIVSTTEVYGRVFMAHSDPSIVSRQDSFVYDRRTSPNLRALKADLDGDDVEANIKFRGVQRYLNYLVGWGWGTESSGDRSEMVRISLPGQPEVFKPEHYLIVGDRRDPVITCQVVDAPVRPTFLVFKQGEHYEIEGTERHTFGEKLVDRRFGCIGSRLAVSTAGHCFFWSAQGPRASQGTGASGELTLPLDYFGFDPTDLIAEGSLDEAFATYAPLQRVVLFVFGQRVYALTIRSGLERAKWSWWELSFTPFSAGILFAGEGGTFAAPTGFPTCACGQLTITQTSIVAAWVNNAHSGDEFVEIWYQEFENLVLSPYMDADGDVDGVVDDFTSQTDAGITATFSLDGTKKAQKIAVTASTGAGGADVYQDMPASPGNVYDLEVCVEGANFVGTAELQITVAWLDGASVELSRETAVTKTTTAKERLHMKDMTAPASTAKARILFTVEALASGDTADGWFALAAFHDQAQDGTWILADSVDVVAGSNQSITITGLSAGSDYRIRYRMGRGFFYTTGYTDADPDNWPASSECYARTPISGLVNDGFFLAYFVTTDNKKHTRITWAVSNAVWTALQAAAAAGSAGFELEKDSGGGFAAFAALQADRNWQPNFDHEHDGVFHYGYDKRWFGRNWNIQMTDDPYNGPWPAIAPTDDLVIFEYDDEDHGHKEIDVSYRCRIFIEAAKSVWSTRERWMGPAHELDEAALGNAPASGHGPIDFAISSTTAGQIDVTMQHSDWYDQFVDGVECPGLNALISGVDYYRRPFDFVTEGEVWYRDMGAGPGPWTLNTPRLTCDGTDADTTDSVTGLVSTNTYEVRMRYRLNFNGESWHGDYTPAKSVVVA